VDGALHAVVHFAAPCSLPVASGLQCDVVNTPMRSKAHLFSSWPASHLVVSELVLERVTAVVCACASLAAHRTHVFLEGNFGDR